MKAVLREEDKEIFTMAEGAILPKINYCIENLNIDAAATLALNEVHAYNVDIFRTAAYFAKNERADNFYFSGSRNLDVEIECYALSEYNNTIYHIKFYLSETQYPNWIENFRQYFFVERYVKTEVSNNERQ